MIRFKYYVNDPKMIKNTIFIIFKCLKHSVDKTEYNNRHTVLEMDSSSYCSL